MNSATNLLKKLREERRSGGPRRKMRHTPDLLAIHVESLRLLTPRLSEGVCALNPHGRIAFANAAFQEILGRSEEDLLGRRLDEFGECGGLGPTGEPHMRLTVDYALMRGRAVDTGESLWRRRDGSQARTICSLKPLVEGSDAYGAVVILTPIGDASVAAAETTPAQQLPTASHGMPHAETLTIERWMDAIDTVTDASLARLPLDDLLEAMMNRLRHTLDLENAAILLPNEDCTSLHVRAASGAGRERASEISFPMGAGLTGEVMRTRMPVIIADAEEILRRSLAVTKSLQAIKNVKSLLITPLVVEENVIGLLYMGASAGGRFGSYDMRLAQMAGERAALAIERARAAEAEARAREEAARAQRRLHILAEASESLVGPLSYEDVAARLVALIVPSFADACALYLVEDDGIIRRVATKEAAGSRLSARAKASLARAMRLLPEESDTFDTFDQAHIDVQDNLVISNDMPVGGGKRRKHAAPVVTLSVPVEAHGHQRGALYIFYSIEHPFEPAELTLIHGLTHRAAVGIENARLYAELESALKQVSDTAIQLDAIFESTNAGIFVTDSQGSLLRTNAYGARMLGLNATTLGSLPPPFAETYELRDESGAPIPLEQQPLRIACEQGRPVEQRVTIHRFDSGSDLRTLARCAPMLDGYNRVIGAVGAFMDITGIYEMERQKDEFLGIASHELKTPLTSLNILGHLLARKLGENGTPRELEQAQRLVTTIKRMELLINDLLDVSKIQEGRLTLNLTVCDLGEICRDAVHEEETLTQRPITVTLPDLEEYPVHADIERLRQVVVNLLSNALKYSPPNAPVSLTIHEAGSNFIVSVEDRGPGLPIEEQRRLFQRFYRVPGVKVQAGSGVGLGLGLYICRDIVERHHGKIWVESEVGRGSVFSFSIPRANPAALDGASAAASTAS